MYCYHREEKDSVLKVTKIKEIIRDNGEVIFDTNTIVRIEVSEIEKYPIGGIEGRGEFIFFTSSDRHTVYRYHQPTGQVSEFSLLTYFVTLDFNVPSTYYKLNTSTNI